MTVGVELIANLQLDSKAPRIYWASSLTDMPPIELDLRTCIDFRTRPTTSAADKTPLTHSFPQLSDRATRDMTIPPLPRLLRTALIGWWNNRALSMGAAIAFYTLFSLAPVLLITISVAGLVFGQEAARGSIVAEISALVGPEPAEAIQAMIQSAGDFGASLLAAVIGAATFLLLATGVFVELQDDLNIIWNAPPQSSGLAALVRTRLLSLALVVSIGFLLLVSLILDAALTAMTSYIEQFELGFSAFLAAINFGFSVAMAALLFALIFKVLPDVHIEWSTVWIGAATTALLFALGKFLIGFYIGRSGIASSYGAAGSLVTILLWIYYSSQILLFGAEISKAYADWRARESDESREPV